MADTENAIAELLAGIAKHCPHFQPSVFPFKNNPHKIEDLVPVKCATSDEYNEWISTVSKDLGQVSFKTKLNYAQRNVEIVEIKFVSDVDFMLSCPEKILSMLVQGNESEISIAIERFLELNGLEMSVDEGRGLFREVYNSTYALRVLISNIAGFQVVIGKNTLPLSEKVDALEVLKSLIKTKENKSKKQLVEKEEGAGKEEKHGGKNKKRRRAK